MIPALLIKICTVPKALTAASMTFFPSATDPGAIAAFPPASHKHCIQLRTAGLTLLDLVDDGLSRLLRDIIDYY